MNQHRAVLFVFSGLPGVGKTTLAMRLSNALGAVYLRVDTIEQALRDLIGIDVEGEGYRLAYRLANDNLVLGLNVVSDSCNPIALTRQEWNNVAKHSNASVCNIEVVCSDEIEHRSRVEARRLPIPNLVLPNWDDVCTREYHAWADEAAIRLDSAGKDADQCINELMEILQQKGYNS